MFYAHFRYRAAYAPLRQTVIFPKSWCPVVHVFSPRLESDRIWWLSIIYLMLCNFDVPLLGYLCPFSFNSLVRRLVYLVRRRSLARLIGSSDAISQPLHFFASASFSSRLTTATFKRRVGPPIPCRTVPYHTHICNVLPNIHASCIWYGTAWAGTAGHPSLPPFPRFPNPSRFYFALDRSFSDNILFLQSDDVVYHPITFLFPPLFLDPTPSTYRAS